MLFTIFTTLVATLAHTNSKKKKKKHIQNPQEILEQLNFGTTVCFPNKQFFSPLVQIYHHRNHPNCKRSNGNWYFTEVKRSLRENIPATSCQSHFTCNLIIRKEE